MLPSREQLSFVVSSMLRALHISALRSSVREYPIENMMQVFRALVTPHGVPPTPM